jgi:predicted branched-subunit amino acid permease
MSFGDKISTAIIGSTQGKVATAGYAVLLTTLIISVVYNNSREDPKTKLSAAEIALVFVLLIVAYLLAIYSINCMVIGAAPGVGCGMWAWVNAVIVLVFAVAIMLSTFASKTLTPPSWSGVVA